MKKFSLILLLLIGSSTAFSQDYDARLLKAYSSEELEEMKSNDNDKLNLLVYALENGMYVTDSNAKSSGLPTIEAPVGEATFADIGLKITNQNQYFQIAGQNKMLVVKSFWVLNNELENK